MALDIRIVIEMALEENWLNSIHLFPKVIYENIFCRQTLKYVLFLSYNKHIIS